MNQGGIEVGDPPQRTRIRWLIAVLFFGLGDVATTGIGIGMNGITEAAPIAALLIQQYGLGAMIPLKLCVISGCFLIWRLTPYPYCIGVPLGLALVGIVATGWNVHVLILSLLGTP